MTNFFHLFFLDDPLSAVDAQTGKHIFYHVVKELLAKKTRILVTHQLQFLKDCDHVYVMDQGKIIESGTFIELQQKQNGILSELLKKHLASEKETEKSPENGQKTSKISKKNGKKQLEKSPKTEKEKKDLKGGDLMSKEERQEGSVSLKVFWQYITLLSTFGIPGLVIAIIVLFLFFFAQLAIVSGDIWITIWSANAFPFLGTAGYIFFFFVIGFFGLIFVLCRDIMFLNVTLTAAKKMHERALKRVMRGTMGLI